MKKSIQGFAAVTLPFLAALFCIGSAFGGRAGGWGMIGDSGADEYRADDNRGGSYGATTFNWIELLARYRGFDFGEWGTRSTPRRTGYEFNWARSGATASTLISGGQHTGLAEQIQAGLVDNVILQIGVNDFSTSGIYDDIYSGSLTGGALQAKLDEIYADIVLALQTVKDAGADNIFWGTIQDRGLGAVYVEHYPNAAARQVVTNAINQVNNRVTTFAQINDIIVVDMTQFANTFLPQVDANGKLHIGSELIDLMVAGDEPHHLILGDQEHGGTVIEGLMANYFIDAVNTRGFLFTKFSTGELLQNAGIEEQQDQSAPTVSLTAPSNNATVLGTVTVSATASDDIGVIGVQFKLDGASLGGEVGQAPYSISWSTAQTANGVHTLTAVARDASGKTTTSAPRTVTINNAAGDNTAPQVTITTPVNGAKVSGQFNVTASASDNVGVVGVQLKIDGAILDAEDTTAPYLRAWNTRTVSNGTHTVSAVARDLAGNTTTKSVTVTVNNGGAPLVSFATPTNGATVTGTVSVTANASDDVGVIGVQFKIDGANLGTEDTSAPYTLSWDSRTKTNGSHTLSAVARDGAGNSSTATTTVTVSNDATPPSVSFTTPGNGATVTGVINVTANATDNVGVVGVQLKVDGANLGPEDTSAPYTQSWDSRTKTNGSHTLSAVARDQAGNTSTATITVTVSNDATPPSVSFATPGNGASVTGVINVTANASDNVGVIGVQLRVDGASLGAEDTSAPYTQSWDSRTATNGSHTFSAVARDQSGNTTTATISVTVSNDATAPTVSFTAPGTDATVGGMINVSATATDNVGVVGVQFRINGANLGSEDTVGPYSVSWNSALVADGQYTLTAVARDASGNTASASRVIVVDNMIGELPIVLLPSSDVIHQGTYGSGNAASASVNDNTYLVTRSVFSGLTGILQTDLMFTGAGGAVSRLDVSVVAKSTTSSTRIGVSLLNVTTGAWTEFRYLTVGTTEAVLAFNVTSSPAAYVDATGGITMRVTGSKLLSSYSVSVDLASVTVIR